MCVLMMSRDCTADPVVLKASLMVDDWFFAWVPACCIRPTDNAAMVQRLGADVVVDYKTQSVREALAGMKFDIV